MNSLESILGSIHLSSIEDNCAPTTSCLLGTKQGEAEEEDNTKDVRDNNADDDVDDDDDDEDEEGEDGDEEDSDDDDYIVDNEESDQETGDNVQPPRKARSIKPKSDGDLYVQAMHIINGTKDYNKLRVIDCKAYLRKHNLRLTGSKSVLVSRIREHVEIKEGGAEVKYPKSSFTINCTGDACSGDAVLFEQRVYENFDLASRSSKGPLIGKRLVAGRIIKESYGAKKQQHTFTIEVLWCKGVCSLLPLHQLIVKGRNLYRFQTYRQPWDKEDERKQILEEKHQRGAKARRTRRVRIGINIKNISPRREMLRVIPRACATKENSTVLPRPCATKENSAVLPRPCATATIANPAILRKPFATIENSAVFPRPCATVRIANPANLWKPFVTIENSVVFPRPCATATIANPAILRKPFATIENSAVFPRPCATAAIVNPIILQKPFATIENSVVFPRLSATTERCSPAILMYMMKVESRHVGCIIGKGGRNIKEIERLSGARLWVRKCANQTHDMLEFRGSQEQIDAAKILVSRYI